MAVVLVQDCPHCSAENTGFTLSGQSRHPRAERMWRMLFTCNRCQLPISAIGRSHIDRAPDAQQGDVVALFSEVRTWPRLAPSRAPLHCPEAVASAFLQADDNIRRENWEAATGMDRRALELATKHIAPDKAKIPLMARIEALAADNLLTPALRDWAHELRTVGNEGLHEEEGVGEADARQTHELARFVLTYLFTLPEQVRLSRELRGK